MSKDSPRTSVLRDNDLIQKGQDDLIRRGDALDAAWEADSLELSTHGAGKIEARINAIPAVQPTVSPELLATTNDVAALVEVLGDLMMHEPDHPDTIWENARATLARVKEKPNDLS